MPYKFLYLERDSAPYYTKDGRPMHYVPRTNGEGTRPTTKADARKLGLLVSPTTVLDCVLAKEALVRWRIEQAGLALLTDPGLAEVCACPKCGRKPTVTADDFVRRVMLEERQQDSERSKAAEIGTELHRELRWWYRDSLPEERLVHDFESLEKAIVAAIFAADTLGVCRRSEQVVIGRGYAGMLDWLGELEVDAESELEAKMLTEDILSR